MSILDEIEAERQRQNDEAIASYAPTLLDLAYEHLGVASDHDINNHKELVRINLVSAAALIVAEIERIDLTSSPP